MSTTPRPTRPIKLHRFRLSGHAHRAELFLSLLGLPYQPIEVDLVAKEQKTPAFLAMNPFGQVPVIDDDGTIVADSNAILVYLASKYDDGRWLPRDPAGAAAVQRWLSVAAGPLAHGPAAARVAVLFGAPVNTDELITRSHALFSVMDAVLGKADFLAGPAPTIADIAAYSYAARAPEGKVSLEPYPRLRAWLARIEALPGFLPMPVSKVGLAA